MAKRTEADKLARGAITVILAGKEWEIAPLVIRDAREWRKKAVRTLSGVTQYASISTDDPQGFANAIDAMLVAMPDQMTDLFFDYAKKLDREAIESTATEAELAKAIEEVMEVAFPLLRSMTSSWGKLSQ